MTWKIETHPNGTNKTTEPGRILVATDGTADGIAGVRYAAQEAHRRSVILEVVHAIPAFLPIGPFPMMPDDSLKSYGREALLEATKEAAEVAPDVEVHTTLVTGGRVDSIVEMAEGAGLIVLGTHPAAFSERLWSGATVPGVASRATCPVIAVPADYRSDQQHGRVIVGVKQPDKSADLLAAAFATAEQMGAKLTVLHAWKLPTGYDDLFSNREDREQWRADTEAAIEAVLTEAELRKRFPSVPVELEVIHGSADLVINTESAHADRVIITRPVHGSYFHHLGSTARSVLRGAKCPVEVFPPVR